MKKYEYLIGTWQGNEVSNVQETINVLGAAGWRAVSIHEKPWLGEEIEVKIYFERELNE